MKILLQEGVKLALFEERFPTTIHNGSASNTTF